MPCLTLTQFPLLGVASPHWLFFYFFLFKQSGRTSFRATPSLNLFLLLIGLSGGFSLFSPAQDSELPAKPTQYVTDYTASLSADQLAQLNREMSDYEAQTSNQVLALILNTVPDGYDPAQFGADAIRQWGVGQKGKDNGVILLVFLQSHKLFIATSRGLSGAIPDALGAEICRNTIGPLLRNHDYFGGVQAGLKAIELAAKGEYTGTGTTIYKAKVKKSRNADSNISPIFVFVIFFIIFIILSRYSRRRTYYYSGGVWDSGPMVYINTGNSGGGFSSGDSGSSSGGDSGGFSGGGGDSDGGGGGSSF